MGAYETAMSKIRGERLADARIDAKNWWRSLSASEKEAGFHHAQSLSIRVRLVRIPIPYEGIIHVVVYTMYGPSSHEVKISESVRGKLRTFVREGAKNKWFVKIQSGSVDLWRFEGEKRVANSSQSFLF